MAIQITDELLKKRPLSASSLKKFGGLEGSPKKYVHYITTTRKDKGEFVIGSATEAFIYEAVIEDYSFNDEFQLYEKFDRRSNADKEKWAKMVKDAKASKVQLINYEQFEQAKAMADIALQTDETRYYLDRIAKDKDGNHLIQKKVFWTDKKTRLPIIGYIDFVADIEGTLIIVDIKTDRNGAPDGFTRDAKYLDYIIQVGAYLTGYHKMYYQFPEFMFMVIDKVEPYDSIMLHCESDYCQAAKDEFEHILTAFRYCMDKNLFHKGYSFWSADIGYFGMGKDRFMKLKSTSNE